MPACLRCHQEKTVDEFPKDAQKKSGFRRHCKACHVQDQHGRYLKNRQRVLDYCKQWRAKNRVRRNAADRRWRQNNPARWIYAQLKNRCRVSGTAFDLTPDDIRIPAYCPVLGIPMTGTSSVLGKRPPGTPSVDRIDPLRGYVKGNINIISFRANRLKQNATAKEMAAILAYILKPEDFKPK